MAYIKTIGVGDAGEAMGKIYDEAQSRASYVAQIIQVMSLDAATCQTSLMFYVTLMKSDNALDRAEREMLATVVSNANGCFY